MWKNQNVLGSQPIFWCHLTTSAKQLLAAEKICFRTHYKADGDKIKLKLATNYFITVLYPVTWLFCTRISLVIFFFCTLLIIFRYPINVRIAILISSHSFMPLSFPGYPNNILISLWANGQLSIFSAGRLKWKGSDWKGRVFILFFSFIFRGLLVFIRKHLHFISR